MAEVIEVVSVPNENSKKVIDDLATIQKPFLNLTETIHVTKELKARTLSVTTRPACRASHVQMDQAALFFANHHVSLRF